MNPSPFEITATSISPPTLIKSEVIFFFKEVILINNLHISTKSSFDNIPIDSKIGNKIWFFKLKIFNSKLVIILLLRLMNLYKISLKLSKLPLIHKNISKYKVTNS